MKKFLIPSLLIVGIVGVVLLFLGKPEPEVEPVREDGPMERVAVVEEQHAVAAEPATFIWDGTSLAAAKAAWEAGNEGVAGDVNAVVARAEKELRQKPVSVVGDGGNPVPGASKNDYYSIGPYWWPNPDTADGLPYVRRDGEFNRSNDKNRKDLETLVNAVRYLALAWFFTDDRRYADHAALLLRVWFLDPETRMNPNFRYAQAVPGISDGRAIGLIDGVTFRELIDGVQILKDSPGLSASEYEGIRAWFSDFLTWYLESDFGKEESAAANNHATWYFAQVGLYAVFCGREQEIPVLFEARLPALAAGQIESDGRQPHELERTRSMHYSIYNLLAWEDLATLSRRVGLDYWAPSGTVGDRLVAGLHYLAGFASPESEWPHPEIKEGPERGHLLTLFLRALVVRPDDTVLRAAVAKLPEDSSRAMIARLAYGQISNQPNPKPR